MVDACGARCRFVMSALFFGESVFRQRLEVVDVDVAIGLDVFQGAIVSGG